VNHLLRLFDQSIIPPANRIDGGAGSFALPSNALEVLCETCIFSKRRRTRPLKNLKAPKNTLWVLETEALCGSAQPSNHIRAGAAGSDPIERACAVEKLNDEFIAIHDRGLRLANDCANGRVPSSAPQKHPSITNGREVCRLWIVVSHRNGCGPPRIIASGIIACPTFFASDWLVAVTMISRGVRT